MATKTMNPLLATTILLLFAVLVGSAVMLFGGEYLETMPHTEEAQPEICRTDIQVNPLKALQIRHVNGEISEEEYYRLEENARNSAE